MHRRQQGSSAGKASVEASGSRSKKLAATDESLMLEGFGINGSRQRLKAQWEPGVELSDGTMAVMFLVCMTDTSKILLSVSFQNVQGRAILEGGDEKNAGRVE